MQLLYTNPHPSPEFASLSLVLQPDPEDPNGGGMGEPLLLASPLSTISCDVATSALKELHKYLNCLSGLILLEGKEVSIHDQIVAELMQDDDRMVMTDDSSKINPAGTSSKDKLQVFRPLSAHGMGLHYRLLKDDKIKTEFASMILAASRSTKSSSNSEPDSRKLEKKLLGVLVCVGLSGIPYAHCSSSLQYGLNQRVTDCIGVLSKRIGTGDVGAAKTILSTLLVTEDEVRKTNPVAEADVTTALPESGEDLAGLGKSAKKSSAFKSLVMMNKGAENETNIHVGLSSTSNDLSRILIERLNVLSVAESDSLLRSYETSGQQRKANLDLTGTKSRFRKRNSITLANADLDNFDYRGPVRSDRGGDNSHQLLLRQQRLNNSASASSAAPPSAMPPQHPPHQHQQQSQQKSSLRQHKADGHKSRRQRSGSVPTLNAPPRGMGSSSRRASSTRTEDSSQGDEEGRGSKRSGKGHGGSRRGTGSTADTTSNLTSTETEDTSETSRSNTGLPRIQVNIALNEDLTCSYKFSKMTSCSVEGVIQAQVKSNARSQVPFQLIVRDPSDHVQTLQENKKFAEDTSGSDKGNRSFTIGVPKADNYFPLLRYKCSNELRPVPIRVQTRVKVDGGFCRVALQISSNPHNEGSLTDLTIIMGVANEIQGESLVTQPAGGVWNASKRSVIWCVSELGDGEKFQLQARFEIDPESAAAKDDQDVPKFPVLVRCQCMFAQLSDVEVAVKDMPEIQPAEVTMKVARRFRLSHQERS